MEPLCRLLRATGTVPQNVWQHLGFTGIADFRIGAQDVKLHHFGAEVENSLFWAGYGEDWEGTTLLAWERLARENNVIFDIGANTGIFALAAHAANPRAAIHAFEPVPTIYERLLANIELNGFPVIAHDCAISDHDGHAEIKLMQSAHEYSASFEHMEWMDGSAVVTVDVPMRSLTSIIAETKAAPSLIKLDVERHEPQALRGLWAGLGKAPMPAMIVEILDDECAEAVAAEIDGKGYRTYVIREGNGITAEPLRHVPGTMNWLFLPENAKGFAQELAASEGISQSQLRNGRMA